MEKKKIFYGWWIVLGAIVVLGTMGPAAVAVANIFQSSVTAEFGISNSQFALTNSIVLGVGIFLSPFISQKLAYGNFKRTFAIGVLLYALGYAGYGLAPNIWVIYFLSLLIGIGNTACIIIPTGILINNWFVKKRGLAMSLALTGLGFGGAILSPLLTGLIESIGWRQTYLVYGAVMLAVGLFVVTFVFKPRPEDIGLKPYGVEELSDVRSNSETSGESQEQTQGVPMSVKETMSKPFFILLIVGGVFAGIVNNGGFGQFPPVLQDLHGAATAATIVSLYSAIGIAGKVILGNLTDRFGVIVSTIYCAVLLALAYISMLFAGNLMFAFVMALFFGLGNAVGTVLPPLITSSIYSTENYPKAYGYIQGGLQLGMTLGSLVAASIADLTGTYTVSWTVLTVASLLLGLSWVFANKNAQKYTSTKSAVSTK